MKKLKLKNLITRIILFFVPIIIVFSDDDRFGIKDRIKFAFEALSKMSFFLWIYSYFQLWYNNNQLFSESLGWVLIINMLVGMALHYKLGTFSWIELFIKTVKMLFIIFAVYISLKAMHNLLAESFFGGLFKNSVEIMTVFYPASKVLENTFILTNGKYPPEFLIKALYNYKKDGKLKDFFEVLKGNGSPSSNEQKEEVKEEENDNTTISTSGKNS